MPRCNCAPVSETRWQHLLRLQAEIGEKQAELAHVMKAAQDAGELRVRGSLEPDATVLACHHHRQFTSRQLQTDTLHGTLDSILGLTRQTRVIDSTFAIDVWTNRTT